MVTRSGFFAASAAKSRCSANTVGAELRYVRAGTLDDPIAITPDVHIYTRSKVDSVTLPSRDTGVRGVLRH